jgi:hypothetical protein
MVLKGRPFVRLRMAFLGGGLSFGLFVRGQAHTHLRSCQKMLLIVS